jgi:hypothetical protein
MGDLQTVPSESTFSLESFSDKPTTFPISESLPLLDYDIASRRRSIAISSLSIVLINGVIPAVLFYGLLYGVSLKLVHILF